MLDLIIVAGVLAVVMLMLAQLGAEAPLASPLAAGVLAVLAGGYWTLAEGSRYGRTAGKLVMQLRVVRYEDGEALGYRAAALRAVARLVPICVGLAVPAAALAALVVLAVDHLWPLGDRTARRALHDRMAGSAVVGTPAEYSDVTILSDQWKSPVWRSGGEQRAG